MAKRIPEGITPDDFNTIRKLLGDFRDKIGASQVSMRLNESDEEDHGFSYFVGFVQDDATRKKGEDLGFPDPGLFRFGDDVPSKEYRETVKRTLEFSARKTASPFVERDWSTINVSAGKYPNEYKKKGLGSKNIDVHTGVHYRKYIGILVDGIKNNGSSASRCVGMLGVGFPSKAAAQAVRDLDDQIKNWAQTPGTGSSLIKYLRDAFELGGPIVK
jgi:hypothetical protein